MTLYRIHLDGKIRLAKIYEMRFSGEKLIKNCKNVTILELIISDFPKMDCRARIRHGEIWRIKEYWRHGYIIYCRIENQ